MLKEQHFPIIRRFGFPGCPQARLFYSPCIESTQDFARNSRFINTAEGSLFWAQEQSAGRGRQGRDWHSPAGGLWFTLLLKPENFPAEEFPPFSLVAALVVAQVLDRYTPNFHWGVKWPNDVGLFYPVRVKGGYRKIAGILLESETKGRKLSRLYLGVGINLNNPIPPALTSSAINLFKIRKKRTNLSILLRRLQIRLFTAYRTFQQQKLLPFHKQYEERLLFRGEQLWISCGKEKYCGLLQGIDYSGRLQLTTGGETRIFSTGEIILP